MAATVPGTPRNAVFDLFESRLRGCVGLVLDSLSEELFDIFIARAREAMEVRLVAVDAEHTVRQQHVGMNVERQRGIEPLHERDGAALDREVDPRSI